MATTTTMTARPTRLSRPVAFWTLGVTLAFLLFASSAPSPLYVVYQAEWHFSPITLTSVFAVYVVALLLALLVAGSLSDRVGRRPVLLLALAVQAAGMGLFVAAQGVELLFAARIVQGLATGVAIGAISAALIDLQPPSRPHLGALVSSAAPLLGLAAGALGSGLLVEYAPDPLRLVFWLLIGIFAAAIAGILAMPETVADRGGWLAGLRPRVGIPAAARGPFVAAAPVMVATWALGGLYLSLGPSLAVSLLHTTSHVTGGLVIVALSATGALASIAVRDHLPERVMIGGAALLTVGVALTLAALNDGGTALFFAGSVIAGLGFGPAFSGALKSVAPLASAGERAGLIAAVYVVSYLGFSLPAIAAGVAVTHEGLLRTTNVYGGGVMALALAAMALTVLRRRAA
jgi:MFS family permease